MAEGWLETQLGEHIDLTTGFAFRSKDFTTSCVRLARGDNVNRGQFEWGDKAKYWPAVTPELAQYCLEEGDVLIGMDGSRVGENWARVKKEDLPSLLVQRVARLRGKNSLDQGFLWYLIANTEFVSFVKANATGTSIPHISGPQIRRFPILLPDIGVQKAIVSILDSLDTKIELNRQTAKTLEETARALFRSWFVDFDPVYAKAEGRETGLPADIADLFPDAFDADSLPSGWQPTPACDLAELARDGVEPSELDPQSPYVGLDSMPKRQLGLTNWGEASEVTSVKTRFSSGDLLFGKLRPYFHKVVVAPCDGICSSDIFVFRSKNSGHRHFMYLAFSQDEFVEAASGASTGTRMPRADWKFMRGIEFVTAPPQVMAAFENIAGSLIDPVVKQHGETRALTELRDTLLPKLISGELRIPEAEEAVAAA